VAFVFAFPLFELAHLPPRQYSTPTWIYVFAHLGFIVSLAVLTLGVALSPARELILIEFYSQTGLIRNLHATIHNRNTPACYDFVFLGLPGIMRVACIRKL